jgi:hypothetical protein
MILFIIDSNELHYLAGSLLIEGKAPTRVDYIATLVPMPPKYQPAVFSSLLVEEEQTSLRSIHFRVFLAFDNDARHLVVIGEYHSQGAIWLNDVDASDLDPVKRFHVGGLGTCQKHSCEDRAQDGRVSRKDLLISDFQIAPL